MSTFSERMGLVQPRTVMQADSMDYRLRMDLWNVSLNRYFNMPHETRVTQIHHYGRMMLREVWMKHFGWSIDKLPNTWGLVVTEMRKEYFKAEWYRCYDFVESLPQCWHGSNESHRKQINDDFVIQCNEALARNMSAYRFVGYKLAPIVTPSEILAVEDAMGLPGRLSQVGLHIGTALDLLANRETPDYRNSIKESISAVESLCRRIPGVTAKTLGEALKQIEQQGILELHGALKGAFMQLYGYTSDAEGIRHALMDEPNLDAEDATFMLVTCSAFVNYLIQKATKAGIEF